MQRGRSRAVAWAGLFGLCAWALPAWAQPVVIDDFSAVSATWPKDQTTLGNPEIEHIPGSGDHLLGEVRKLSLHDFSPGGGISRVEIGVFPPKTGDAFLEYVSSVNTDAALRLRYDADPNADGLNPNLNLNLLVNPQVSVTVSYFDFANSIPMDVSLTISDGVNSATEVLSLNHVVELPAPETLVFDFSSRLGALNPADIDWIEFDFDPGPASDFRLAGIVAIPEPAAAGLLLLGAGLILRRRRP